MNVKVVQTQSDWLSEWDNQPMGRYGIAPGIFISGPASSKGLTQRRACDIIPPLKASALWRPDGLETEGTGSLPVRSSSESQRSCSLATIHI